LRNASKNQQAFLEGRRFGTGDGRAIVFVREGRAAIFAKANILAEKARPKEASSSGRECCGRFYAGLLFCGKFLASM
jgi:hypothetical protein